MIKYTSKALISLVAFILLTFLYAVVELGAQTDEIKCSAGAYVIYDGPNGLNVRNKPDGKVITRLPAGAMVTIIAYKDGWVKIGEADYPGDEEFAKKNHHPCKEGWTDLKDINGWIFAKLLGTSVRNYDPGKDEYLLAENILTSKKTVKFEDTEAVVIVLECSGDWLKVQYRDKPGWLNPELNCPNSLTTCP